MPRPSIEALREYFSADIETGKIYLKVSRQVSMVGAEVGSHDAHGYAQVCMGSGNVLKAHRVIWAIHHGEWPDGPIDHINGDRADNRLSNLRVATDRMNSENKRAAMPFSKTGLLGVSPHGKGYRAHIVVAGKQKYLGYFKDPQLAHEAYLAAKRRLHEGCTL